MEFYLLLILVYIVIPTAILIALIAIVILMPSVLLIILPILFCTIIISIWRNKKRHAWIELNRVSLYIWDTRRSSGEEDQIDLGYCSDGASISCEYLDNQRTTLSLEYRCGIGQSLMGTITIESVTDLSNIEKRLHGSILEVLFWTHAFYKIKPHTNIYIGLDGDCRREVCDQIQSVAEEFIIRFICSDYYGKVFINSHRIATK